MNTILRPVLKRLWYDHWILLTVALTYVAIGGYVQTEVLGRRWPIRLTSEWFATIWVWGSTIWLLTHVAARRWRRRTRLSADQVLGAVLLATLAVPVQITFQSLKQSLGRTRGFPWDARLAALDEALHGGPAWHWYEFILGWPTLLKSLDLLYVAWFATLLATVIWLCWTRLRALRRRALLALLLLWIGAGTIGGWVFASAGPCYTAASNPGAAELLARLDATQSAVIARTAQWNVWENMQRDRWVTFGGVSAMPSLHVGLAVLLALIVWRRNRWLGAGLSLYAVLIHVGSVILGWHYAIDGYAGGLCAWGAWVAAGALVSRPIPAEDARAAGGHSAAMAASAVALVTRTGRRLERDHPLMIAPAHSASRLHE